MNISIRKVLSIILGIMIIIHVVIPLSVVLYIYIVENFFYYPKATYLLYTVDKINNNCRSLVVVKPSITHIFQLIGSLKKTNSTLIYVGHTFVRNTRGEPVKHPGIYVGEWKWYYTFIYGLAGLLGWMSRGVVNNTYVLVVNIPTNIRGKVFLLGCGDNYTSAIYTRESRGHIDVVGHTVYLSEIHKYNLTELMVKYFGSDPCPCKCGVVPPKSRTANNSRVPPRQQGLRNP